MQKLIKNIKFFSLQALPGKCKLRDLTFRINTVIFFFFTIWDSVVPCFYSILMVHILIAFHQ